MSKKFVYFTKLVMQNVRAFGDRQELLLTTNANSSAPARWTLIIGENGVGKTTLLQCLANMRPVPSERSKAPDGKKEKCVDPAFSAEFDNKTFDALARAGNDVRLDLTATLSLGIPLDHVGKRRIKTIDTSLTVRRKSEEIETIEPNGTFIDDFEEPLVIGYGASRHMGYANASKIASSASVASLFDATLELLDAEEVLQQLDYSKLKKERGAGKLLKALLAALATILPNIGSPKHIKIYGPKALGLKGKKGVYVQTQTGLIPFSSLSLGYQTVSAWTIDIAWRLFQRYPESINPLAEPAIVLVDEIDLHLHPKWQRQIRKNLSEHFPNVQFIATAHSPLMAQTYLDANLAVIRLENQQAVIENNPLVIRDWRIDQVITSELFGLKSARPPDIETKIQRQKDLIQKTRLTSIEKKELKELDNVLIGLPTEEFPKDNEALDIIRRAAQALQHKGVVR